MSLTIPVCRVCDKCGRKFDAVVHGMLNSLVPEDINLVSSDKLNVLTCPHCGHKSRAPIAVLYHEMVSRSYIWYKPCDDTDEFFDSLDTFYKIGSVTYEREPIVVHSWKSFKDTFSKIQPNVSKMTKKHFDKIRQVQEKIDSLLSQFLEISYEPMFVLKNNSCTYVVHINPKGVIWLIAMLIGLGFVIFALSTHP